MSTYKLICEDFDNYDTNRYQSANRNISLLNTAGAATNISRIWKRPTDKRIKAICIGLTSLHYLISQLSTSMRDKRQKIIFNKIIERYPTANDFIIFANKNGLPINGLNPQLNQEQYIKWIAKYILKSTTLNHLLHILFGLDPVGAIVNKSRLTDARNSTADRLILSAMR